jgi:hypothetical protein
MNRALLLLMALFLAVAVQAAEDPLAVAERALTALDETSMDGWAFTERLIRNGTEVLLRHDPARPRGERWKVISVDGRPPTAKEIEEYTGHREKGEDEERGEGEDKEQSAVIETDSLVFIEESPTHLVYGFQPAPEGEDDDEAKAFNEHVDGVLRIAKSGPYVESIEMRSREPFSPMLSVKIKEFSTIMTFAPVGDEGTVLPSSVVMNMKGRALLFKKINEKVETSYSEYEYIGEQD